MSLRAFFRLFTQIQLLPVMEGGEETLVGGQAVMEGVMMRAPHSYCVAVRKPDGAIVTEEMPLARISETYPIFKYPIFRGMGTIYQALKLGIKALRFSTTAALDDPSLPADQRLGEIPTWAVAGPLLFSAAFFIFLYKFVPLYLITRLGGFYPVLKGHVALNLVEGAIRIGILLTFLFTLSLMKDMRRMFEYHGAEHKVVFNYESGQPLTVENAQKFTTFHPRCGTSFLFVLMFLAVPVYMLIPFDTFLPRFLCRVALLPLIVGISYELIRFAARRRGSVLALVTAPGLWLQRITTKPPSDDQAAVAIHALEGAMALEEKQGGELVIA
ncbi:MAG TPA: DUF1385 domain-containing protein [Bryobacteraceae bacterium]|nr:DUF1385 domain-containing protein [Bryobacteraceae bacterium]